MGTEVERSRSSSYADLGSTRAPTPLDITGGVRTVVFARKTPDHRGLVLTGNLNVELKETGIELSREGPGLSMKIQAKDCAQGGLFQMEPERGDGTTTDITHVLATAVAPGGSNTTVFYFDNPNFRAREGDVVWDARAVRTRNPRANAARATQFRAFVVYPRHRNESRSKV